jgi:hypothetical protein
MKLLAARMKSLEKIVPKLQEPPFVISEEVMYGPVSTGFISLEFWYLLEMQISKGKKFRYFFGLHIFTLDVLM